MQSYLNFSNVFGMIYLPNIKHVEDLNTSLELFMGEQSLRLRAAGFKARCAEFLCYNWKEYKVSNIFPTADLLQTLKVINIHHY